MASTIRNIAYAHKYESNGEEKVKWLQCGVLIEKDDKFYIKLEAIPVGQNPDGGIFFNVFDRDHNRGGDKNRRDVPGEDIDPSDDIPF